MQYFEDTADRGSGRERIEGRDLEGVFVRDIREEGL